MEKTSVSASAVSANEWNNNFRLTTWVFFILQQNTNATYYKSQHVCAKEQRTAATVNAKCSLCQRWVLLFFHVTPRSGSRRGARAAAGQPLNPVPPAHHHWNTTTVSAPAMCLHMDAKAVNKIPTTNSNLCHVTLPLHYTTVSGRWQFYIWWWKEFRVHSVCMYISIYIQTWVKTVNLVRMTLLQTSKLNHLVNQRPQHLHEMYLKAQRGGSVGRLICTTLNCEVGPAKQNSLEPTS